MRKSICLKCIMSLYDAFVFEHCSNDSYSQEYNIYQIFGHYLHDPVTVPQVFLVFMAAIVNCTKGTTTRACFTCTHGLLQELFPAFAAALSPRLEKFMDAAMVRNSVFSVVDSDGAFVPFTEALMKNDFGMGSIFKCSNIQVIDDLPLVSEAVPG